MLSFFFFFLYTEAAYFPKINSWLGKNYLGPVQCLLHSTCCLVDMQGLLTDAENYFLRTSLKSRYSWFRKVSLGSGRSPEEEMLTYFTCTLFCFRRRVEMNSTQPENRGVLFWCKITISLLPFPTPGPHQKKSVTASTGVWMPRLLI